jgi:hypothetical protein
MGLSYEEKITSQNGEDGIIKELVSAIKFPNKTFLEIGWGDGGANMTINLMKQGWSGVGVDAADPLPNTTNYNNFKHFQEYVYPDTCKKYLEGIPLDCDFFSLDIDSFDYDISKKLLESGFRPKTVCVEINARFGPSAIGSFPYVDKGVFKKKLYRKTNWFGCSLEKYRVLWKNYGYTYFGYDSSATNAFFYHTESCNFIDLPILSDLEFPYKDDKTMRDLVAGHQYWVDKQELIFKE